jgi:hypothetical protein
LRYWKADQYFATTDSPVRLPHGASGVSHPTAIARRLQLYDFMLILGLTQGWARDVTDEIANEVRGKCGAEISSSLAAFLDAH